LWNWSWTDCHAKREQQQQNRHPKRREAQRLPEPSHQIAPRVRGQTGVAASPVRDVGFAKSDSLVRIGLSQLGIQIDSGALELRLCRGSDSGRGLP
jgi:hypothetical protein